MPMANSEGLPGLAAVVLVGTSALEVVRSIFGPAFPALSELGSVALRAVLIALWLAAALAMLLRRHGHRGAVATAGRLGWASLAIYGLVETILRVGDGSVHLVAAMIVAVAVEGMAGTLDPERDKILRGA